MDRRARRATVHGVTKSWTRLKGLSTHAHTPCGRTFSSKVVGLDGDLKDTVCSHVLLVAVEKLHSKDPTDLSQVVQDRKKSIHLAGVSTPCCEFFIPIIESKGKVFQY